MRMSSRPASLPRFTTPCANGPSKNSGKIVSTWKITGGSSPLSLRAILPRCVWLPDRSPRRWIAQKGPADCHPPPAVRCRRPRPRRLPRVLPIGATATHALSVSGSLLKDLQGKPAIQLHSRRPKNRADGARGSTLFADHLAKIAGGHPQFQNGDLFARDLGDHNLVRDVDQSFRDIFNQLFHSPRLPKVNGNRTQPCTRERQPA